MANTNIDGKSSVNIGRLTMWQLTADTKDELAYGDAYTFPNELNAAKYAPKVQTASQYGDGHKVEDFVCKDGGDIDVTIRGFKPGDKAFLFGEKENAAGVSISSSADIVPYVGCAYLLEMPDGKVKLLKFPKVKWMPQGEDSKQREGSTISYSTAALKGTYSPTINGQIDMLTSPVLSLEDDAEFITKWFTDAAFVGDETTTGDETTGD